jgi:hypothetical protein
MLVSKVPMPNAANAPARTAETRPQTLKSSSWKPLATLPDGPLDLVGDIHGEIGALECLMGHLGYGPSGSHPDGRRLVFLGDLIDRGPDSQAVVRKVADLVDRGRALAILGNHDLSAVGLRQKSFNTWLFGHGPISPAEKAITTESERREILDFLARLPVAAERPDLRVVHAYWDEQGLRRLDGEPGPKEAQQAHYLRIKARFGPEAEKVERNLALQNENPMKLITSGPEKRALAPFFAGGKMREESRRPWWDSYLGERWLAFGHYWRIPAPGLQKDDGLLSKYPLHTTVGRGNAICIDYSVGGRYHERKEGKVHGPFTGRLAALRWPGRTLVFDDGERRRVLSHCESTLDPSGSVPA